LTDSVKQTLEDYNLRYTEEDDLCFKRRKKGKGFQYLDEKDRNVTDEKLKERFKSLVIPPAWKNVLICSDKKGHIQATGWDKKGRKQYIYHEKWEEFRSVTKFNRLIEFGEALPEIRKQVKKDLRKKSLLRTKVLAVIIRLLEETLIRVGNEIYAEQNKSYGLTTLKDKHIHIKGITIYFHFNGKSGKPFELDLKDRTLAGIVSSCQELPGQNLFQYIDEDGNPRRVESADVNEYLNSIVEKDFTAKDFRTWGATVITAENLSRVLPSDNENKNKKLISDVVKQTAAELNNTPAVCREYYIHPYIIDAWMDGYLAKAMSAGYKIRSGSDRTEEAVLRILKKYSKEIRD